jgi:leucyl-tRNA---protein transferase
VSIERRNFPQFFITAPAPCPYLAGRVERKIFTHLIGHDAAQLNSQLSQGGFRRSQNIAYRPACDGCTSCVSVRVRVNSFAWTRSFRRTMARNRDIEGQSIRAKATGEQYSLFRAYIDSRHGDGGMVDMTVLDFSAMVDDSFVNSRIVEYRFSAQDGERGPLAAAVLTDRLEDGLSMIYSFYDPELGGRGLGTFMILDHILRAQRFGLPYLYLGYWVEGSAKMSYKSKFLPQERLTPDGWVLANS